VLDQLKIPAVLKVTMCVLIYRSVYSTAGPKSRYRKAAA